MIVHAIMVGHHHCDVQRTSQPGFGSGFKPLPKHGVWRQSLHAYVSTSLRLLLLLQLRSVKMVRCSQLLLLVL
jgi:hypothetical protein